MWNPRIEIWGDLLLDKKDQICIRNRNTHVLNLEIIGLEKFWGQPKLDESESNLAVRGILASQSVVIGHCSVKLLSLKERQN